MFRFQGFFIVGLLALALVSQSLVFIPEGRTGVIFNLKGGIQENALKEGMHFLIPFVQRLIVFDTRIKTYSFSNNDRSPIRIGEPIVTKTKDGQEAHVEMSIVTQMVKERTPEVYKNLRVNFEETLKKKTSAKTLEIVAKHVAESLYTEQTRNAVSDELYKALSLSFEEAGFELKEVLLRRIDFSDDYIEAIERKQVALQKAQLAEIEKAIALKQKQIEIIRGEAESQTVEIKGRAVQVNPKVAELEYLEAIEKHGGGTPVVTGLKGNTFVNLDKILPN